MTQPTLPMISIVLVASQVKEVFFRACLDTIVHQTYNDFELYVIDDNPHSGFKAITDEFFPEDVRVHYRQLKNHRGKAYAANIGFHFAEGDYVMLVQGEDCIHESALFTIAQKIIENDSCDVIYTDSNELEGLDFVRPCFRQGYNKELLLHSHYMGDFITVKRSLYDSIGGFRETLSSAYVYDFLLRCAEKKASFLHINNQLYHKRVTMEDIVAQEELPQEVDPRTGRAYTVEVDYQKTLFEKLVDNIKHYVAENDAVNRKRIDRKVYHEYVAASKAYLHRMGIAATVSDDPKGDYWKIAYDGKGAYANTRDYILLKGNDVKVRTKESVEKMYGLLKVDDVAVVGVRFMKSQMTVDNCGYIFSREGDVWPAYYNTRAYNRGYENQAVIPREVSMVDAAYCMIDKRIYRRLGGFDPKLTGRDAMLDFCLRAKALGYRVIVDPSIIAKKPISEEVTSSASHEALMAKDGDIISQGDPYYSDHLAMGLENHVI